MNIPSSLPYWQHFQWLSDPFALELDLASAYVSSGWEQLLDLLQHWLSHQNTLITLLAPKGAGKTTLLKLLSYQLQENSRVEYLSAQKISDASSFINFLEETFQLPQILGDTLEEQLENLVHHIQYHEKPCILFLDEAQDFSPEIFDTVFYLIKQQSSHQMRLHVVAAGPVELLTKLAKVTADEASKRKLFHCLELRPFTLEETRQYILHRLVQAGLRQGLPFNRNTLERIYKMSEGRPEEINQKAREFLIEEVERLHPAQENSVFQKFQSHFIGGGVLLLAFLVLAFFMLRQPAPLLNTSAPRLASSSGLNFSPQTNNLSNNYLASSASSFPLSSAGGANGNIQPSSPSPAGTGTSHLANNPTPAMATSSTSPLAASSPPATSSSLSSSNPSVSATSSQGAPLPMPNASVNLGKQPTTIASASASNNPPSAERVAVSAPSSTPIMAPPPASIIRPSGPVTTQSTAQAVTVKPSSALPTQDVAATPNMITTAPTNSAAASSFSGGTHLQRVSAHKSKLADVNSPINNAAASLDRGNSAAHSGRYTLQLVALSQEAAAKKFIADHHLNGRAHYVAHVVNGNRFYVVQLGSYLTSTAAKAAVKDLPPDLQARAWPRKQ